MRFFSTRYFPASRTRLKTGWSPRATPPARCSRRPSTSSAASSKACRHPRQAAAQHGGRQRGTVHHRWLGTTTTTVFDIMPNGKAGGVYGRGYPRAFLGLHYKIQLPVPPPPFFSLLIINLHHRHFMSVRDPPNPPPQPLPPRFVSETVLELFWASIWIG